MTKRIVLAGLAGGLAMFIWESVAHMATPLGDMGLQSIANEQAVMSVVRQTITRPGFYFFPGPQYTPGMTGDQKKQAMAVAMDKMKTGPGGIMIVDPGGSEPLSPSQFVVQFACDIGSMLLAAILVIAAGPPSYSRRVLFVAALGHIPSLATEVPYWNWYKFPADYTMAQFVVHVIGFAVGGSVVARMAGPPFAARIVAIRDAA